MIDNFDYYKNTFRIQNPVFTIHGSAGDITINSGDTLVHFINGDPDITEKVRFIGTDENGSPLFLLIDTADDSHTVSAIEDTENLFPENRNRK